MRVICIEDAIWGDGPYEGQVSTHKGSIYHVTGSIEGQEVREKTGEPYASGTWYSLLEVNGIHHSMRFLEIPDDDVLEKSNLLQQTNYN